jgi:hypothetical protein
MTSRQTGWILILAAFGTFLLGVGPTVSDLQDWHGASNPEIVGKLLMQLGTVILAAVGGKLLPNGDRS